MKAAKKYEEKREGSKKQHVAYLDDLVSNIRHSKTASNIHQNFDVSKLVCSRNFLNCLIKNAIKDLPVCCIRIIRILEDHMKTGDNVERRFRVKLSLSGSSSSTDIAYTFCAIVGYNVG